MHTLGFNFKPWIDEKSIADGPSIKRYLSETISENKMHEHISARDQAGLQPIGRVSLVAGL